MLHGVLHRFEFLAHVQLPPPATVRRLISSMDPLKTETQEAPNVAGTLAGLLEVRLSTLSGG